MLPFCRRNEHVCAVACILLSFSFHAGAQTCHVEHGRAPVLVYGEVTDPSGAAITGAPVVLACGTDQISAVTDKAGHYSMRVLPGEWTVEIQVSDFDKLRRNLTVAGGDDLQVDFPLQMVANKAQVEVRTGTEGYTTADTDLGTRTNTSIMEVPQAVYVIPQAILRDQQVVKLADATRNVSGVVFANDAGGRNESMVMRGYTSSILFKDGFRNDGSSTRTYAEMSNVERVEILKGPSSTVFGRLDPSGVINLVTKQPLPSPQVSIEMQGGSFQFLRPIVDITGPLTHSGKLLGRMIGSGQDSQSFRDFNVQHRLFLSPTLTWTPTKWTSVRFYSEFLGGSGMTDRGLIALGTRPANLPISRYIADPSLQYPFREGKAGLSVDQALPHDFTFRSYERSSTGYAMYNARIANSINTDGVSVRLNDIISDQYFQSHYWVNEVTGRVHTGWIEHTVLIGGELNYELFDTKTLRATNASKINLNFYHPDYAALPARSLAVNRIDQTRNGYGGGYLQDQIRWTPKILFTVGIRYDMAKMKTVGYLLTQSSSQRSTAWSPRLGLTYRPIEALAFYATWSRSFQPQSGLDVSGNAFSPERGKLLEAGAKYDTWHHRATGTVSIYQIDKQNVLTTDPNNTSYQIQVGAQRSKGIEWNQTTRVGRSWNLMNGYAFNEAYVSKDNTYLVGTGLIAAPRHTGNIWLQYRPAHGWASRSSWGAGVFGVSKSQGQLRTQAAPGTYFLLPGYARVDMGTSYDFGSRNAWTYRLAVNANNLLDRRYFTGSGGRFAVYPGSPRNLIFSLQLLHTRAER